MSRPTLLNRLLLAGLLLLVVQSKGSADDGTTPALSGWIDALIKQHEIDALSIAVVDGDKIVWSAGFGWADPHTKTPASADSIYRVGSISKLFTDITAMQLVEEGKLDLDAPLSKALPDFKTDEGWERQVTLRQIMAHRAGLVREPPVGHYFDPTRPTLIATVDSLKKTRLVHPPGTHFKYSNAGIALIGRVVETLGGVSFEDSVQKTLLQPLGMSDATFAKAPERLPKQVVGKMWTLDGRSFDAPGFAMGIGPAGDLRSSVVDLSKFAIALMRGGKTDTGSILTKVRIDEMWTPKYDSQGARAEVGVGFFLSKLDGHRRVGHGGAVYGCATELMILPDDRLAVIVATSKDCANGTATRVGEAVLRTWLAKREGRTLAPPVLSKPLDFATPQAAAGSFGTDSRIELIPSGSQLFAWKSDGGTPVELRRLENRFVADDAFGFGAVYRLEGRTLKTGGLDYVATTSLSQNSKPEWDGLIGEYGWDHNTLTILEKEGKLHALIEWFFLYPLEQVNADKYRFPSTGLYSDEGVVFKRDASGQATVVVAAGVKFERRPIEGEGNRTFRIKPLRPVEELRIEASKAEPPKESDALLGPDLIDLSTLDPTIKLDIRYATDNNFLGTPLYTSPRAFLQRPAAQALLRAHWTASRKGYGLLIHDGYRPWSVTKIFWDATPVESRGFVANPAKGSRHNRGCAVDLSLYDLNTGKPVAMVSGYDEFSARAYPDYVGGTSQQRRRRDLLRKIMEAEGFTVNANEWWHFDYKDWPKYRIGNRSFEDLSKGDAP